VVVLRGTLSRAGRDLCLATVLAVPGVTRVANYLETDAPPKDLEYAP
jgi:hypothetical protein